MNGCVFYFLWGISAKDLTSQGVMRTNVTTCSDTFCYNLSHFRYRRLSGGPTLLGWLENRELEANHPWEKLSDLWPVVILLLKLQESSISEEELEEQAVQAQGQEMLTGMGVESLASFFQQLRMYQDRENHE